MVIYVVVGTTGEYSDRSEWLVRAFHVEEDARAFAEKCGREAADLFATCNKYEFRQLVGKHPSDPRCQWDYTGTSYFVADVELNA